MSNCALSIILLSLIAGSGVVGVALMIAMLRKMRQR